MSSIVLTKKSLMEALRGLSLLVARRQKDRSDSGVFFAVRAGGVSLTANNAEQLVEYHDTDAESSEDVKFVLKMTDLQEIAKLRPLNEKFTFTIHDSEIVRLDYDGNIREYVQIKREFPEEADMSGCQPLAVGKEFFSRLRMALPMVSSDINAMATKCILLEPSRIVATNRQQLMVLEYELGIDRPVMLLPPKLLPLLQEPGELAYDENVVEIKSGSWRTQIKIPSGAFPKYEQVIPRKSSLVSDFSIGNRDNAVLLNALEKLKVEEAHEPVSLCGWKGKVFLVAGIARPDASSLPCSNYTTVHDDSLLAFTMSKQSLLDALKSGFTRFRSREGRVILSQSGISGDYLLFMALSGDTPQESLINAISKISPIPNNKEENIVMKSNEEKTPQSAVQENFRVIEPRQTDPLVSVTKALDQLRTAVQGLNSCTNEVCKQFREAQRTSKLRERNFRDLQSTIERFRKVASF